MAWKNYTVRINNQSSLGTLLPDDVMEGIWDGRTPQGNYPALDNKNYLNVEVDEISGSVIYSANATIGTPTADTVFTLLRVNGDLTINSGVTVTTPARKLGLAILVKGNCTINGTLDMTARGANHNGSSIAETLNPNSADSGFLNTYPGRVIRLFSGNLNLISLIGTTATPNGSSNNISLPDQGSAGGQNVSAQGVDAFNALSTGGGGAGQGNAPGLGAAGSTFSGGTGGGGSSTTAGRNGTPNGGRGGLGGTNGNLVVGGGAGNPGGAGATNGTGNAPNLAGLSGTGGLLILFVTGTVANTTGTLTIGSSGKILSRGSNGFDAGQDGGGSGGGVICIAAKNYALTTNYEISAAGGSGFGAGRGGNGSVNLYQLVG